MNPIIVAANVRIEDYLFGNILGIADWDLWFLFAAGALVLSVLVLLQRPLLVLIFSSEIAGTQGIPIKVMEHLLTAILIITMVTSLQAVGALLTLGLLVAPASTLYLFSDSPRVILWGGATLGCTLAVGAVIISNQANVQTGPAMVILLAGVFLVGFIFSPRYGLLAVMRSKHLFKHSR